MIQTIQRTVLIAALALFSGYMFAQTCTVSNLNNGGDEVALLLMTGPYADSYLFDGSGSFTQNEDGTAQLTGTVIGAVSGNTIDIDVYFENGSSWSAWSAMGRGYKDEPGIVGDNYLDYTYYEMSSSSTLSVNAGDDILTLNHAPANYFYGFQVGVGANATTPVAGLGGWFTYASDAGNGQGDFLLEGDCPLDQGPCEALAASISTTSETTICAGDGEDDFIEVSVDATGAGSNTAWVITDSDLNILGLPAAPPFNLEGAGAGTCLIWYLNFEDDLTGAAVGENAANLGGCFALSNSIAITRLTGDDCPEPPCDASAASISTSSETTICAGDGVDDFIEVSVDATGNGSNAAWVITDSDLNILGLPAAPPFNLEGAGAGTCLIWYLNFEDDLTGAAVGENAANLGGCFALSNSIAITRLTGDDCPEPPCDASAATISTTSETTFCTDDDITDDIVSVSVDAAGVGTNATWVITSEDLTILGLPTGSEFNFDGVPAGTCLIWLINHEDDLTGAEVGLNAADLGGCFSLSNSIAVTRLTGDDCPTVEVPGCTDDTACNYDADANVDDGSCVIATGCDECDDNGGVIDNPEAGETCDDGDADTENDVIGTDCVCSGTPIADVPGCTDDNACNYSADATVDDGSCVIATGCDECDGNGGVIDNPEAGETCDDGDANTENDVIGTDCVCAGTPVVDIPGCTDDDACNYNPNATVDDGSCFDATGCDECDGNGGLIDNPEAGETCDDGNPDTENDVIGTDCVCAGTPVVDVPGCTDPSSSNFDPAATVNDGSCQYLCDTDPADLLTVTNNTAFDDGSGNSFGSPSGMGLLAGGNNVFGGFLWNVNTAGLTSNGICISIDYTITGDAADFPRLLEFRIENNGTPNANQFNMEVPGPGTYTFGGIISSGGQLGSGFDPDGASPGIVAAMAYFPGDESTLSGDVIVAFSNLCVSTDCGDEIFGCTDPNSNNFNPDATVEDGSCLYDVTFNVDMNCFDGNDPDIEIDGNGTFTTPSVEGPGFGWCGSCVPMADPDMDGIWSVTVELPAGLFEYKYAHDVFAGQEQLVDDMIGGANCAPVTDFASFANRQVLVGPGAVTNDVYGSCGVCEPFDCPDLMANIGDACDDGNANTENDIVLDDCTCVGGEVFECPDLQANIGDACDDGNGNTENDLVQSDCACSGTPVVVSCGVGLEGIIVEKYYVTDANDAANTAEGNDIAEGAVTYRVYVDMAEGYELSAVFGDVGVPLIIGTTTEFYNTVAVGRTYGGDISNTGLDGIFGLNTLALDSWLTFGRASDIHVGTPKVSDPDGSIIGGVNNDGGLLANDDPAAGIPLTVSDGLVAGTVAEGYATVGTEIVDAVNLYFGAANSPSGNAFTVSSGAYSTLGGSFGTNAQNQILIGQFTTDGVFSFDLNIALNAPDLTSEAYNHTSCAMLSYTSDEGEGLQTIGTLGAVINTYPNPNLGESFVLELDNMPGEGEDVLIELIDTFGHIYPLSRFVNEDEASSRTINFDSSLSNGLYLLSVRYNGVVTTHKIIVSK